MARLYPILFLADIALIVIALISCLSADEGDLRALPRIAWVFIILLFSPIGPIAYLIAGRPINAAPRPGVWQPGGGFPEAERPLLRRQVAPDDDPDFLKGLAKQNRDDADLLRRWEDDLKRREDELKRRERGENPEG
ncbi:MAG TPA: PLD nuclease N-terminal domain-containing protein [Micromonosporaceae bacterium]|nr:PLD nuclease N-terminal domain-containing protein [Micromonosporaceae bacterium]